MAHVEIKHELPEEHPRRQAVEQAFREVLGRDADSWTVILLLIHGIFWTVLLIRDRDGFRKVLLLDTPTEQGPGAIAAELRSLLDEAHAQRSRGGDLAASRVA
jgi:hypothetical protein